MTNTNDKNPQATEKPVTHNGPTSTVNTPTPKPTANESGKPTTDPNKVIDPTTTGAPTKQPLDPNTTQANNDKTNAPAAPKPAADHQA